MGSPLFYLPKILDLGESDAGDKHASLDYYSNAPRLVLKY
jgi:hypothetical protein